MQAGAKFYQSENSIIVFFTSRSSVAANSTSLSLHTQQSQGLLRGSGKDYSEDYWRQLEALLFSQGLLKYDTNRPQRPAGFKNSPHPRLSTLMSITTAGASKAICGVHMPVNTKQTRFVMQISRARLMYLMQGIHTRSCWKDTVIFESGLGG